MAIFWKNQQTRSQLGNNNPTGLRSAAEPHKGVTVSWMNLGVFLADRLSSGYVVTVQRSKQRVGKDTLFSPRKVEA